MCVEACHANAQDIAEASLAHGPPQERAIDGAIMDKLLHRREDDIILCALVTTQAVSLSFPSNNYLTCVSVVQDLLCASPMTAGAREP